MDGEGGTRRDTEEDEESGDSLGFDGLPDADEGYSYLDNGDTLSDMVDEVEDAAESMEEDDEEDGRRITKADVTEFVEGYAGAQSPGSPVEVGAEWSGGEPGGFVEFGWLDLNHRVTSKGAAVLNVAADVIRETGGGSSGLKAYLNTESIRTFLDRVEDEHDVELENDI